MRCRRQHTPHAVGCLLLLAIAGPAFAMEPPIAEERIAGRCERVAHCASLYGPEEIRQARRDQQPDPSAPQAPPAGPAGDEEPRTSFLRWLHTDVMWVPTESGNQTFGLVGVHLAVARLGRFDIYGPPGVMVIRQRTSLGWQYRPAFTWGISFFLADFQIPMTGRNAYVFVNLSKCWVTGDVRSGMNMGGFSLTWRR